MNTPTPHATSGFSLVEIMLFLAMVGILVLILPKFVLNFHRFFALNSTRLQLTGQSRDSLDGIERLISQGKASSVTVTRGGPTCSGGVPCGAGYPLYSTGNQTDFSAIQFNLGSAGNRQVSIWQDGRKLKILVEGSAEREFSNYLESIYFLYPDSSDDRTISVQLTLSKYPFASQLWGGKKYLQARSLVIRFNNG